MCVFLTGQGVCWAGRFVGYVPHLMGLVFASLYRDTPGQAGVQGRRPMGVKGSGDCRGRNKRVFSVLPHSSVILRKVGGTKRQAMPSSPVFPLSEV